MESSGKGYRKAKEKEHEVNGDEWKGTAMLGGGGSSSNKGVTQVLGD